MSTAAAKSANKDSYCSSMEDIDWLSRHVHMCIEQLPTAGIALPYSSRCPFSEPCTLEVTLIATQLRSQADRSILCICAVGPCHKHRTAQPLSFAR